MERLNGDEQVSEIRVFGKIPFVSMDGTTQKREISLILIDTPGPNNSRNPDHGKKQRELLGNGINFEPSIALIRVDFPALMVATTHTSKSSLIAKSNAALFGE